MRRIDALADDQPERFQLLTGRALSPELDEALQAIVRSLAVDLKAPIALVSLVLSRTQFFRAHVGLPPDLAAARATDRDASFCQFVVKDGARFVVTDARSDERVPQDLVERYGIRSYVGAPVRIGGTVVGSLCAIDHEPREFAAGDLALLDELARRASVRMEELALSSDGLTDTLLTRASTPAFSELRNLMLPLAGNISLARTALADIGSLVRLWFELPPELRRAAEHTAPALGSLDGASRAWADLATVIDDLEVVEQRLRPIVVSLEQLVLPADEPAVGNIVETASHLAHQRLKIVGGVQWQVDSCATTVTTPRMLAVSTLAAALSLTASGMRAGQPGGMTGHVRCEPADVVFALGADGFDPTWALRRLQTLLRGTPEIGLAASADQLMLRMPRAPSGR